MTWDERRAADERMAQYWAPSRAPRAVKEPLEVGGPDPDRGAEPEERDEPGAPARLDEHEGDVTLGIPERPPVRGLAILGVILGCVLLIVLLLYVLINMLPSGGPRTVEPTATGPTGAPAETVALGTPFTLGPIGVQVDGLREIPGNASEQPAPGMRWVAVALSVTNDSPEEQDISMLSMFDLEVAGGASYSPTIIGTVPEYVEGRLAPGDRLEGEVVFEIPIDALAELLLITSPDRAADAAVDLAGPAED